MEGLGPQDLAYIVSQCNLTPRTFIKLYLDDKLAKAESYLFTIKQYLAGESCFVSLIKVWERPMGDLARFVKALSSSIKDKKIMHYQMLGIVSAVAYINHTYTSGSIAEKVLGLAIGSYAKEANFTSLQTAKAIDIVTKRFPEFYLPGPQTLERYKENREVYFTRLISFHAGALGILGPKVAGEVFGYMFSPPEREIEEETGMHRAMECLFLRKLMDAMGYSTSQSGDFVEAWDVRNYMREFLQRIGKIHSYGFTYDRHSKAIVRSNGQPRALPSDSVVAKLLS